MFLGLPRTTRDKKDGTYLRGVSEKVIKNSNRTSE